MWLHFKQCTYFWSLSTFPPPSFSPKLWEKIKVLCGAGMVEQRDAAPATGQQVTTVVPKKGTCKGPFSSLLPEAAAEAKAPRSKRVYK